eukprot:6214827-Pleurochrysis_carterae.AAC.4
MYSKAVSAVLAGRSADSTRSAICDSTAYTFPVVQARWVQPVGLLEKSSLAYMMRLCGCYALAPSKLLIYKGSRVYCSLAVPRRG